MRGLDSGMEAAEASHGDRSRAVRSAPVVIGILILGVAASRLPAQGPLTPPGPPEPTMKRLDEVEPRTLIDEIPYEITNPGSYYLTTNLTVTADGEDPDEAGEQEGQEEQQAVNGPGIVIASDHVRLDLNGFELVGTAQGSSGVQVDGARSGIVVGHGTIRGWTIGLEAPEASRVRVEGLVVTENRQAGLQVGDDARLLRCDGVANQGDGLMLGARGMVEQCTATGNGGRGLIAGEGVQVTGGGFSNNQGHGVEAESAAVLRDVTAAGNTEAGLMVGGSSLVRACSVRENGQSGIQVGSGSLVADCFAHGNSNNGIRVESECVVKQNYSHNNFNARDAAGIHAAGTDNAIHDNTVVANDRGISAGESGNLILRNQTANNTLTFFLAEDQVQGPVFDGRRDLEEATHPWLNFDY